MLKQFWKVLPYIRSANKSTNKTFCCSIASFQSKSFSSDSGNNESGDNNAMIVNSWINTLSTADKERIRYIRNEVFFNETNRISTVKIRFDPILFKCPQITLHMLEGKTLFKPEDVTITEYMQLLSLSPNQRKSFYRVLRKTKISQKSNKVNK